MNPGPSGECCKKRQAPRRQKAQAGAAGYHQKSARSQSSVCGVDDVPASDAPIIRQSCPGFKDVQGGQWAMAVQSGGTERLD